MQPLPWLPNPTPPALQPRVVHLWQRSLGATELEYQRLWALLSADEQQRAQRFVRQQDCRSFVVARGTLRQLLAHYLGLDAGALTFDYGDRGKPQLSAHCNSR